jgi:hypothetical protein
MFRGLLSAHSTQLSAADAITSLRPKGKTKLNHVEMGAYAHLFGYVEEFVAPKMVTLARDFEIGGREALDAVAKFAAVQALRRRATCFASS